MKSIIKIFFTTIIFCLITYASFINFTFDNIMITDLIIFLVIILIYILFIFIIIRNGKKSALDIMKEIGFLLPSYDEYNNIINNKNSNYYMISVDNSNYDHIEFITDDSNRILYIIKQKLFSNSSYNIYNPFNNRIGKINKKISFIINECISINDRRFEIRKTSKIRELSFGIVNTDLFIETYDTSLKGVIYNKNIKIGAIDELIDKDKRIYRHAYFKIYDTSFTYEVISLILGMYVIKKMVRDI